MNTTSRDEPGEGQPPDPSAGAAGALGLATASVACLAVAFAIVGAIAVGARTGLGVGLGGAIAVVNLVVFARVVRGVLGSGSGGNRIWVLVGIIKIIALFGGVWLILRSALVSPLALIVGYGALPLGIALGGFLAPRAPESLQAEEAADGDDAGSGVGRTGRKDRK